MISEHFLFYVFSSIALVSSGMVIRSKNPVHSVLFLILVFCNAAGLLLLLDLDFFAMIFLVVYVGAIAVLFLFVVMMLNVKFVEMNENTLRYLPVGGFIGLIFLFEIFLVLENDFISLIPGFMMESCLTPYIDWSSQIRRLQNIQALGLVLYTCYFYYFLQASLILLIAMIGAIVLTMHKGSMVRRQEIYDQNSREFAKTIRKLV